MSWRMKGLAADSPNLQSLELLMKASNSPPAQYSNTQQYSDVACKQTNNTINTFLSKCKSWFTLLHLPALHVTTQFTWKCMKLYCYPKNMYVYFTSLFCVTPLYNVHFILVKNTHWYCSLTCVWLFFQALKFSSNHVFRKDIKHKGETIDNVINI